MNVLEQPGSPPQAMASSGEKRPARNGAADSNAAEGDRRDPSDKKDSRRAAELRWFFAHASVGSNIIDGLTELRKEDGERFPITTIFSKETPPDETARGVIYEYNRGNPGWKAKIDGFEKVVRGGWHWPRVDVVMNKLCYVDYLASARYYVQSMAKLEAEFPETTFVYMTMPVTAAADIRNILRNRFNKAVRRWTAEMKRPLFDIAGIEAHDAEGRECAFGISGMRFQKLCKDYTDDGGHLNAAGRVATARAFYGLGRDQTDRTDQSDLRER